MQRNCDVCGVAYEAKRATSRYCSPRHRTQAARKGASKPRGSAPVVVPIRAAASSEPSDGPGPIESATLAELGAVDRVTTSAGQRALMLAHLLDNPPPLSLSSVAGWSREHGAALAAATAGVDQPRPKSALDLARERRDAQRHA